LNRGCTSSSCGISAQCPIPDHLSASTDAHTPRSTAFARRLVPCASERRWAKARSAVPTPSLRCNRGCSAALSPPYNSSPPSLTRWSMLTGRQHGLPDQVRQ
jgi:hypothetical protein